MSPATVRVNPAFLADVQQEEVGSWEDYGHPEAGQPGYHEEGMTAEDAADTIEHAYIILGRHRDRIELRSEAERELIAHHVLDNSIDKARGHVEEWQFEPDQASKARRWLRNLENLRAKLLAAEL